jgi:NhaP-type Na+/H+ or K+/H+ antiporter
LLPTRTQPARPLDNASDACRTALRWRDAVGFFAHASDWHDVAAPTARIARRARDLMHPLDDPALVVSLAMFAGVAAQIVARHVNVPGIVLLLVTGVVLGPDLAGVIRPHALGRGLEGIVEIAVAVILFEGGLSLNLRVLRTQQTPIRRLVLLGAIITAAGGAVCARLCLGWDWRRSLLFGTLVIVTGPTVITPLLRRIHVRHSVETILEAEGIFIDALGATIAVVALEVLQAAASHRFDTAVLGVVSRFGFGTVFGIASGAIFALSMRLRSTLPEGLLNVTALASAILILEASDAIVPESGITAVILAGMVVGHTRSHELGELREFKEQLTVLLVATLFVLLSADVRIEDVRALGLPGVLAVFGLIFVVRPVNVFASTFGTKLELREKLFLAWMAPRGIVAAAVSSLFAERMADIGIPGGTAMRALVFLVIGTTVIVQGMGAGWIASLLKLRLPRGVGYAVLGAHPMARALGDALRRAGEEVVFIDTNADSARAAEESGFKVVFGDGLDERGLIKARVETRRACIGATPNESVNFLFARRVREWARGVTTYVAIDRTDGGVSLDMVDRNRARVLFAGAHELADWRISAEKSRLQLERRSASVDCSDDATSFEALPAGIALPLTVSRGKNTAPVERFYRAKKDDEVELAVRAESASEVATWLDENGWTKVAEPSAPIPPP